MNALIPIKNQMSADRNGIDTALIVLSRLVFCTFFWLVACPFEGHAQPKKKLTTADYKLWGTHEFDQISDRGNWVSYHMYYENDTDTLLVMQREGKDYYKIARGKSGSFAGDHSFACKVENDLEWLDLQHKTKRIIYNVQAYSFSATGSYLVTLEGHSFMQLVIRTRLGNVVYTKEGVLNFAMNNSRTALAFAAADHQNTSAAILHLDPVIATTDIAKEGSAAFDQFLWQDNDQSLVFTAKYAAAGNGAQKRNMYLYDTILKKRYNFDPEQQSNFPAQLKLPDNYFPYLRIAADGSKVFMALLSKAPCHKFHKDSIQIWNSSDTRVYAQRKMDCDFEASVKIGVWYPKSNRFLVLNDTSQPMISIDGSSGYAVTYNPAALSQPGRYYPNSNYFITDLLTGKRTLWLSDQSTEINKINYSPLTAEVAYFKAGSWWVYNFSTQKHTNVTKGIGLASTGNGSGDSENMQVAGWSSDKKSIILYDAHDIWICDLRGKAARRITDGSKSNIVYRLAWLPRAKGTFGTEIDLTRVLLLSGVKENSSGYFFYDTKRHLKPVVWSDTHKYDLIGAPSGDVWFYKDESFDRPPSVMSISKHQKTPGTVSKTNTQHDLFEWGRSEIIYYKNKGGTLLKGALFFPVGYNPLLKYPMIVKIYEKESYAVNRYVNPSLHSEIGFNLTHLLQNGYVVLLPDIEYVEGDVGMSALDCTVAAVNKVIQMGVADPGAIGLTGNSFSGYETNFIITQTDLFRAAFSGTGLADLQSYYLSMGWPLGRPEIYRFESGQWRMGKSLFEDRESYRRNSPVEHVQHIKTPIFLWTGENDYHVHYFQSVAFYLALWRLDKKHVLVIYPNEGHVISNAARQKDLTMRMDDWFGYYLKGLPPKKWINEAIH